MNLTNHLPLLILFSLSITLTIISLLSPSTVQKQVTYETARSSANPTRPLHFKTMLLPMNRSHTVLLVSHEGGEPVDITNGYPIGGIEEKRGEVIPARVDGERVIVERTDGVEDKRNEEIPPPPPQEEIIMNEAISIEEISSNDTDTDDTANSTEQRRISLQDESSSSSSSSSSSESSEADLPRFFSLASVALLIGVMTGRKLMKKGSLLESFFESDSVEDELAYDDAFTTVGGYGSFATPWTGDLEKFDV